jgi:hypothetical protein
MRVSNGWLWALTIVMLGALAWGLEQVAITPLQTGEVYPPFSTLRSDPQGAKALYESLAALPGITVERLYKQRQKLESSRDAMFVLGVEPAAWSGVEPKTVTDYQKLVQDGGRLVIAFLPVRTPPSLPKKRPVEELWDVKFQYCPVLNDYTSGAAPRITALFFEPGPEWRSLAPDVLERPFGKGTIVLAAETFSLSNEGLRDARDPQFITLLAGAAQRITFDENHFGVTETGSIAKLLRRYRLQGAVAVLIIVAALFLWRSASSLLPPRASGDPASSKGATAGRDSLDGLAALLHRGVPEKQLLAACFAEWSKSAPRDPRSELIEQEIASAGAASTVKVSIVNGYRAACEILTRKT